MDEAIGGTSTQRPRKRLLLVGLLGLEGVVLILLLTAKYGVGMSPDSAAYVSTARNLLQGKGYIDYTGAHYVLWPPLYPTLLAVLGLTGYDLVTIARLVNAIAFGLIVFASGLWFHRHLTSPWLVLIGTVGVLASRPLVEVSVVAFVEPLFVLFSQVFLLGLGAFLQYGRRRWLVTSAVFAGLACLTRYIGVTLILTAVVAILLNRQWPLKRRFTSAGLLTVGGVAAVLVWIVRNVIVSSTLAGPRGQSANTLLQNALLALDAVTGGLTGAGVPSAPRALALAAVVAPGVGATLASRRRGHSRAWQPGGPQLRLLVVFLVIYVASLIVSATLVSVLRMDRYAVPTYVPVLSLVLLLAEQALVNTSLPAKTVAKAGGAIVACLWLTNRFALIVQAAEGYITQGAGYYSTTRWQESSVVRFLDQRSELCSVMYSNAPHGIYALTGLPAVPSPRKYYRHLAPRQATDDLLGLSEVLESSSDVCLVWFEDVLGEAPHYYTVQELKELFLLEPIAALPDGDIYYIHGSPRVPR